MNADVSQNEQTVIHTYLRRVREGVRVDVQVAPEVEEFFRYWGHMQQVEVRNTGRTWKHYPAVPQGPGDGTTPQLMAWGIGNFMTNATDYDVYGVGRSLTALGERGQNISFIRLVGAGAPGGTSFLFEDVVSRDGLEQIAERIRAAASRFYDQYIRQAGYHITTDIRRE